MKNILKNCGWTMAIIAAVILIIGIICGAFHCTFAGIKYGTYLGVSSIFAEFAILILVLYFITPEKSKGV
jgi:hypothetical protein